MRVYLYGTGMHMSLCKDVRCGGYQNVFYFNLSGRKIRFLLLIFLMSFTLLLVTVLTCILKIR